MANLSHGEIAGIVIGCVAGLLLVLALGICCLYSRLRRTDGPDIEASCVPSYVQWSGASYAPSHVHELDTSGAIEYGPARIWEVKPAPRGGQVRIYHTQ
jgi:hypothetical protein